MKKMMFSAFAAAVLAAPALAGAQSPSPSPAPSPQTPPATPPAATAPAQAGEARAAKADKAMGELVKVDAVAKKITIKGADGIETDFAYSDATEVAGGASCNEYVCIASRTCFARGAAAV